jgi:hypothetical protein
MKLKEGDVFTIPLGKDEVGFGQIVIYEKYIFIICIFDFKQQVREMFNLEKITSSSVLFFGHTTKAKIIDKNWPIIGNYQPNLKNIELPYYKQGHPLSEMFITNYNGDKICTATEKEFSKLQYEAVVAPLIYEDALKAHFNIEEWLADTYNDLLYEYVLNSKKIVTEAKARNKKNLGIGIFDKFFNKSNKTQPALVNITSTCEHSVTIHFKYGKKSLDALSALEERIEDVLKKTGAGELDGNEVATDYSDGFLYLYGANAEQLFKVVHPILKSASFMKGAKATLRFGSYEEDANEIEVDI